MRSLRVLALFIFALFPFLSAPVIAQASACQFVLGFQALHDAIPGIVGDCVVDEHHNPDNGDGLQETSGTSGAGGLLVWRKGDNWTAFTDGYRTWVNGPFGLRERLNTECFSWEAGCNNPLPGTSTTVSFTSVIGSSPGGTASATVQTIAGAMCHVDYVGPKGIDRFEDGALHPKVADANGVVSWSWTISKNTPLGTGTVTAACNGVSTTASVSIS